MRFQRIAIRFAFLFLATFALAPAVHAKVNYTDTWEAEGSTEPGWGINFAHTGDFIFVTFYIYGPNRTPVWYTAQLSRTAGETFTGKLYATTGTWFGAPTFTPVPPSDVVEVGVATFTAIDPTRGQLTYRIDLVTVTKNIWRFTTVPMSAAGVYLGGLRTTYSGNCGSPPPTPQLRNVQMVVLQSSAALAFEIKTADAAGTSICAMTGNVVQRGSLLRVATAQYVCASGLNVTSVIESVRPLDDGLELHWTANAGGCIERGSFYGVTQQ
jgi:hypothetical protein